jgi:predicted enzyme related to lactoylglutathione lyase
VPGDVKGGRRADPDPGRAAGDLLLRVTVPPEPVTRTPQRVVSIIVALAAASASAGEHFAREDEPMLRGLSTISYFAADVAAAQAWYTELLGVEAYFSRDVGGAPAYVEFRIGDYQHELGIVDSRFAVTPQQGGAVAYWAVDDVHATYERLLTLGASEHEKPTPRGPGFVTASVLDPFGNILGVMENQHYRDVLTRQVR